MDEKIMRLGEAGLHEVGPAVSGFINQHHVEVFVLGLMALLPRALNAVQLLLARIEDIIVNLRNKS